MNRKYKRLMKKSKKYFNEVKPFYKDGRAYVKLKKDGTMVDRRVDKLCWVTFVDSSLDCTDDSWELDYKDGNYKNCAISNLFRVK